MGQSVANYGFHLYEVSPTALSDFVYQAFGRWLHTDNIHIAAKGEQNHYQLSMS
jgi:hypothetical protein